MSQVSGFQIREGLKVLEMRKGAIVSQFKPALYAFEDDDESESAIDIAEAIKKAETDIASLQTAQAEYNLTVKVKVQGKEISLLQAVKLVGGAGRMEKSWKDAATVRRRARYEREEEQTRSNDETYAKPTMTKAEALTKAMESSRYASALRAAIATGNQEKIEIAGLEASLLQ